MKRKTVSLVKFNQPVAVRSLLCPDHAHNIEPNVVSLTWNLGKRCNYDCSYCSPHVHDFVSPHLDFELVKTFITNIDNEATELGKQIKWAWGGGEAFLHPQFLEICELVHNTNSFYQMNLASNASLPYKTYRKSLDYLTGLTLSLHLERSEKETNRSIETILRLTKDNIKFINVNLMFLPGRLEQTKNIMKTFEDAGVNYVVRRITPNVTIDEIVPYSGKRKRAVLDEVDVQEQKKRDYKRLNDKIVGKVEYYSPEELEFLNNLPKSSWQNIGVWDQDLKYTEMNADDLIARKLHTFDGWSCYAGVDNVFINFDGSIYRASCLNDDPYGHISHSDKIFNINKPTVCKMKWCPCNVEVAIRKCNTGYENLITKSKT